MKPTITNVQFAFELWSQNFDADLCTHEIHDDSRIYYQVSVCLYKC